MSDEWDKWFWEKERLEEVSEHEEPSDHDKLMEAFRRVQFKVERQLQKRNKQQN